MYLQHPAAGGQRFGGAVVYTEHPQGSLPQPAVASKPGGHQAWNRGPAHDGGTGGRPAAGCSYTGHGAGAGLDMGQETRDLGFSH